MNRSTATMAQPIGQAAAGFVCQTTGHRRRGAGVPACPGRPRGGLEPGWTSRSVFSTEGLQELVMPDQGKAVAFDVDGASLTSLRDALPGWEIEVLCGATAVSLTYDWNPKEADLLVVSAHLEWAETSRLCEYLVLSDALAGTFQEVRTATPGLPGRRQSASPSVDVPLLLLLPSWREALMRAGSDVGADGCLVLPVRANAVVRWLARLQEGGRPRRHPLMFCLGRRQRNHWTCSINTAEDYDVNDTTAGDNQGTAAGRA